MKQRQVTLTPPHRRKTRLVRFLRAHEIPVSDNSFINPANFPTDAGRQRLLIRLARRRWLRIEAPPAPYIRPIGRIKLGRDKLLAMLSREQLMAACLRGRGLIIGRAAYYPVSAADAVAEIARRVGPAGEQAQSDEQRYFEQYEREQYESRNHSGTDYREISLAVVASDWSAAILSFAEYGSFLHRRALQGGLHHLRFSVYLLVRDATSGERHIIRIPPRFGRYKSATFRRYFAAASDKQLGEGDADGLIHAAAAWTFGLEADEYEPEIQA